MSKMIQLRHVPDPLHRQLKARAAMEGLSLSDFLIREAKKLVDRPTVAEIRERLARRSPVNTRMSAAEALRRERDQR
jgi:plasmid stability protein